MNILGISAYFHDSSAALVSNGELVAAAAEERFSRLKHDSTFPSRAIASCLEEAGLTSQQLDACFFYEEPHVKFTRVLTSCLAPFPFSAGRFVRAMKSWMGQKLWTKNEISAKLNMHPNAVEFVPHHLSHASHAFFTSPFPEAAILTVDAVGEWTCTSLCRGNSRNGVRIEQIDCIPYPHSLGLVYAAFTAFLGFQPNDQECNTMALAAFGRPVYADQVRKVIRIQEDGTYTIDASYFDFTSHEGRLFRRSFTKLFGAPRHFKDHLPFDALADGGPASPVSDEHQRYADIAASIQFVLEEALLALARRAHRMTGSQTLCLAGGVGLNAVAVGRLQRETPFDEVFLAPDPGDGGGAVGAALYGHHLKTNLPKSAVGLMPYVGRSYDETADAAMLEHIDPKAWTPHMSKGCGGITRDELHFTQYRSFDEVVAPVVEDLGQGRLVGWFQGRFELGPRALGNRSILADPSNVTAARRLSSVVKFRERFRPYALSVREEDAGRVLQIKSDVPRAARWMLTVMPVIEQAIPAVRAATHIDGTTRPQVCSAEDNPRFHKLLSAFGKSRGLGALLNTSFNERGYPIVASPPEALVIFARSELDTVVVNNLVVRKVRR